MRQVLGEVPVAKSEAAGKWEGVVEGCNVVQVLHEVELGGVMGRQNTGEGGVAKTVSIRAMSLEDGWVVGGVPLSADIGIRHRGEGKWRWQRVEMSVLEAQSGWPCQAENDGLSPRATKVSPSRSCFPLGGGGGVDEFRATRAGSMVCKREC